MKKRTLALFLAAAGIVVFHSCQSNDRNGKIGDSIVVDQGKGIKSP